MSKRTKSILFLSLLFSFVIASMVFAIKVNAAECSFKSYQIGGTTYGELVDCWGAKVRTISFDITDSNQQHHYERVDSATKGWNFLVYGPSGSICVSGLVDGAQVGTTGCFSYGNPPAQPTAVPAQGQVNTIVVTATLSSPNIVVVPNGQGGGQQATPDASKLPAGKIQIGALNVNLRAHPSPKNDIQIITVIPSGTIVDYLGQSAGWDNTLWYFVQFGSVQGWVKARVTILGSGTTIVLKDDSTTPPTATPAAPTQATGTCGNAPAPRLIVGQKGRSTNEGKPLNFRKLPSKTGEKNISIPNGGEFFVSTGPECVDGYNWYGVYFGSIFGYIAEGDQDGYFVEPVAGPTPTPELGLTATPAPSMDTVVLNKDGVKVYEKPDTTSKVLLVAPKGTVAPFKLKFITMSKKIWYEVYTGNGTGWIQAEDADLNGVKPTATPQSV